METVTGDLFRSWFDKLTTNGRDVEGFNFAGGLIAYPPVHLRNRERKRRAMIAVQGRVNCPK